jgi:hypothetical protein
MTPGRGAGRTALQNALRGADHGVDRRKGNWTESRAADDRRRVRQPLAKRHDAADRSDRDLRHGRAFRGNIRKRDLQTDTPYNTYTRAGLPPTPIALPGLAALAAALNPARTDALYFVARGDGTSHFSSNLTEHNQAVNKYQR